MQYCPIADYGLIGNTRTAALVSKNGSLDWCCLPLFDSPSFFGAILDANEGGYFSISPKENYKSSQSYLPSTNVLQTIFKTSNGEASLTDCFPVDSEVNKRGELWPLHEILRIIKCISGELEMKLDFSPKSGYGKKKIKIQIVKKLGLRCDLGSEILFLHHDLAPDQISLNSDASSASATFKIKEGERIIFSFIYSNEAPATIPPIGNYALKRLERTIQYWKDWISQCKYQGEYEEDVKRSALLLKLLTFAPSGAILAAPTTSLPEKIYGDLNWDYRYCWLRDAAFTMRALVDLGFYQEAKAYIGWILHSTTLTRPRLQVMYTVYGDSNIPEKILSWLSGYQNSLPVRVGNAADQQFQLDVYGEVMNALYIFAPYMEEKDFDKDTISFITDMGKTVCEVWHLPDKGIWETRGQEVHNTHSKAMAWVALDCLVKICALYKWDIQLEKFITTAALIRADIEMHGYNEELKSYTATYDAEDIDASLLTMSLMNYESHSKERIVNTVLRVKKELSREGFVYRNVYGLNGNEGAFGACSFWLVEALAKSGLKQDARDLLTALLRRKNSVGLWSEEIAPETHAYLGNYPQAFTHTAIIGAALSLQKEQIYEHP